MKKTIAYLELKRRHEKEVNEFPMSFAFNHEQLEEALKELGVTDLSECCTVMDCGDIVRKSDADDLVALLKRHQDETIALIKSDEKIAEEAFRYEMDNHEYAINYDGDDDTLSSLYMTREDLKNWHLEEAYERARVDHCEHFMW